MKASLLRSGTSHDAMAVHSGHAAREAIKHAEWGLGSIGDYAPDNNRFEPTVHNGEIVGIAAVPK